MNFKEVNSRGGRYCACVLPTAHAYQILTRVSYMWGGRGGGGGGGGVGIPPPPPKILKLSMVIIVLSQVLNNNLVPDCVRSMPPDLPSRHTHLCTLLSSCYHHVFPPDSKSCMKPFSLDNWYLRKSLSDLCSCCATCC